MRLLIAKQRSDLANNSLTHIIKAFGGIEDSKVKVSEYVLKQIVEILSINFTGNGYELFRLCIFVRSLTRKYCLLQMLYCMNICLDYADFSIVIKTMDMSLLTSNSNALLILLR